MSVVVACDDLGLVLVVAYVVSALLEIVGIGLVVLDVRGDRVRARDLLDGQVVAERVGERKDLGESDAREPKKRLREVGGVMRGDTPSLSTVRLRPRYRSS